MSPEPSCVLKLKRAYAHLERLQAETLEWVKNHANFSARLEQDPLFLDDFMVLASVEPPSVEPFSLILGDCIQNLRGSLDHLIFALASKNAGSLSEEDARDCQFPIIGDDSKAGKPGNGPNTFRDKALSRLIKNVSPHAQAIIEGLQPYQLGSKYRTHPLWKLGELSNTDKHRFIHVIGAANEGLSFTPSGVMSSLPARVQSMRALMEGQTVIARMTKSFAVAIARDDKMNVRINATLRIVFQHGDLRGEDVLREISIIYEYIRLQVMGGLIASI